MSRRRAWPATRPTRAHATPSWRRAWAALIAGILLAITLARSITRPLRNAVTVAKAVKDGQLDNRIDVSGEDETGELLSSLDAMQARCASAMSGRGLSRPDRRHRQVAGRHRVRHGRQDPQCQREFPQRHGLPLEEIRGQHHSMFVDPAYRARRRVSAFWEKLGRGEYDAGQYKRIGKGGREVWIQASYNPIFRCRGQAVQGRQVRHRHDRAEPAQADSQGQLEAISRAQAVIEFDIDGKVLTANENFLASCRLSASEVVGQHHSMFVDPCISRRAMSTARFWEKLESRRIRRRPLQAHRQGRPRSVDAGSATTRFSMPTAGRSRSSSTPPT